ncbi:MAG: hypothetical protein PHH77_08755 [Victivallaceae bacterium]|nr:hypothetical protein [Victivallaceae bacterium]
MKKKFLLLTIVIGLAFMLFPAPKAKAIDPVTIAILAPIALKAAQVASPYVIRGLTHLGQGLILCGKDLLDVFRLPLGFIQTTIGLPFGGLAPGIKNLFLGSIAPLKLGFHTAMLPLNIFGIGVN